MRRIERNLCAVGLRALLCAALVLAAVHADVESGDRIVFILDSPLAVVK